MLYEWTLPHLGIVKMFPTWLSIPLMLPYRINVGSLSSLVPYSVNGPFKRTLMALFRLAWSNKLQLPILITVCFMAFDIRLQLEINIFWEANHQNERNRQANANAQVIVPVLEIHANEEDDNSVNDSEEENEDETDSDESELQTLRDNNDSDETEDEGENERPNPQSRFFSDSDHNFSDRNSNDGNEDPDSGDGNPPVVVVVGIHRTNISVEDTSNSNSDSYENIEIFCRNQCNLSGNSAISILNAERRQTAYKAFAKPTVNVTKRVLPVPSLPKTILSPNVTAQSCFYRTDIKCLSNPAKNFSLYDCASNFVLYSMRNEN